MDQTHLSPTKRHRIMQTVMNSFAQTRTADLQALCNMRRHRRDARLIQQAAHTPRHIPVRTSESEADAGDGSRSSLKTEASPELTPVPPPISISASLSSRSPEFTKSKPSRLCCETMPIVRSAPEAKDAADIVAQLQGTPYDRVPQLPQFRHRSPTPNLAGLRERRWLNYQLAQSLQDAERRAAHSFARAEEAVKASRVAAAREKVLAKELRARDARRKAAERGIAYRHGFVGRDHMDKLEREESERIAERDAIAHERQQMEKEREEMRMKVEKAEKALADLIQSEEEKAAAAAAAAAATAAAAAEAERELRRTQQAAGPTWKKKGAVEDLSDAHLLSLQKQLVQGDEDLAKLTARLMVSVKMKKKGRQAKDRLEAEGKK